jgi:hypothetical protein
MTSREYDTKSAQDKDVFEKKTVTSQEITHRPGTSFLSKAISG